jgi:hypothetical protein
VGSSRFSLEFLSLGFGVQDLGFRVKVQVLGCRV